MGRPRRRGRGRGGPFTGKPDGLQPGDDIGNRRSFKQQHVPPDDIGNRRESEEEKRQPADDIGNRIEAAPTHEVSGVLAELDGRRRRRKKGSQAQRMGRYLVGGVNPMVAGNVQRAVEAFKEDEQRRQQEGEEGRGKRRRRRRRDAREHVDGEAAQEVSQRRAERFFDFEEDDRFDYQLKTAPEHKREDAERAVGRVLETSARDARVTSQVIEDGDKPKVLVAIEEKGAAASLPESERADNADEPLFVLGNAALMSLNYLVNKIVNRYPDDRIRLAILPKADEASYLDSLAAHRKAHPLSDAAEADADEASPKGKKNGATAPQKPSPAVVEENETAAAETSETAAEIDAEIEAASAEGEPPKTTAKKATKKAAKKATTKKAAKTTKKAAKTTKKAAAKKTTKKAAKADEE